MRYPGGKNKLAKFIANVCKVNLNTEHYIEPYAGGASVALHLLFTDRMKKVTINDKDRAIYAFWHSILHHPEEFCHRIERSVINVSTWKELKKIQNDPDASLFELGFSTFFLNRTNRSGIINGGVVGGIKQEGIYKMDCRFNKTTLIKRIQKIASYKNRINIYNYDAIKLITKIQSKINRKNTFYYFDPPYFRKGPSLYMNSYEKKDHKIVAEHIKKIKDSKWIVSYDSTSEIQNIYNDYEKREYQIVHTAHTNRLGKEILFFSDDTIIPAIVPPMKIIS